MSETEFKGCDCIVIGAGYSGLAAAEVLIKAGKTVILLEARDRVGGRARTETLAGHWLDFGGQWLGPGHTGMYAYAKRYGKTVWPMYVKGRHTTWLAEKLAHHRLPFPTTLPFKALLNLIVTSIRFEWQMRQINPKTPWNAKRAPEWDAITLEQWMQKYLYQPQANAVFKVAVESVLAKHPGDVSLLHALFYFRSNRGFLFATASSGGAQQDRVEGGMQPLAEALANDLKNQGLRLNLNSPVTRIAGSPAGFTVTSGGSEFSASHVIVAVPPVLAREIQMDPELPVATRRMIESLTPGCAMKCFAIYDRPFWREQGLSGSVVSDEGPVHVCFDVTPPNVKTGILMAFIEGREGVKWTDVDEAQRRDTVLKQLGNFFGAKALEPLAYTDHSWLHDEWTRGCYGGTAGPNALHQWGEGLYANNHEVVFAGTEMATQFNGYFEGAVRAGRDAAQQVLKP